NDELQDAKELARFCKHIPCKVNIIEYNPITLADFVNAETDKIDQFANYLRSQDIVTNVRRSRGKDIDGACGQLAIKEEAAVEQVSLYNRLPLHHPSLNIQCHIRCLTSVEIPS